MAVPGAAQAEVDVLVAGSGAAGLVAALTCAVRGLRVMVAERSQAIGGTSALSGGRVWIPGNRFQDDPDEDVRKAATYLDGLLDSAHTDVIDAFLSSGPAMTRDVERYTPHRFEPCSNYPDYHPDRPGATLGGRCLDMRPLDLTGLVPIVERIRRPHGYLPISHGEWEQWRWPAHYDWDLITCRERDRVVTGGPALIAALLDGSVRAGAQIQTGRRLVQFTAGSDGMATASFDDGGTARTHSVVLATGGYDQDPQLRRDYLPAALLASASSPTNTGDALRIVAGLGARLTNLDQGWWMPMVALPGEETDGVPAYRSLIRERGLPRQIVVDRSGRRFVDEACPYHEFGKAMHAVDGHGRHPYMDAFLIFDAGYRRRYPLPGLAPEQPDPAWLTAAGNLPELAQRLGVDADGLVAQVRRWNAYCAAGVDEEFGRGANAYDRYYGDPDLVGGPGQPGNRNLGPIDEPPYFGLRLLSGTIGSKGGPVTDADARVLDAGGRPIAGLYAVGNAAAFWTTDAYPGPGATLGIAMTMAWRAGIDITGSRLAGPSPDVPGPARAAAGQPQHSRSTVAPWPGSAPERTCAPKRTEHDKHNGGPL